MLEINNLSVGYAGRPVVQNVSFSVRAGETVSIVGESGSGKTTVLRAIQGLLGPEGKILAGSVRFDGVQLNELRPEQMRAYRGAAIATVQQQAGLSMDPITKIGRQFHEALSTKGKVTRKESDRRAADCLRALSIKEPEKILNTYPVMLSGGTNQRVALAMAMVMEPCLILADEPTSALDVTVQVEVVQAMQALRQQCDAAILMVTHNMGVVAQMSDYVGVMYDGCLVEWGTRDEVLQNPMHPYTQTLLSSVLRMDGSVPEGKTIYRDAAPSGCIFYSRCPRCTPLCTERRPAMQLEGGHQALCHRLGRSERHG